MKTENTTAENVAIILLAIVGTAYRGLALMVTWSWLVADRVGGTRRLSYGEAVLIPIMLGLLASRSDLKEKTDGPSSVLMCASQNLIIPTLVIIFAAVAKAVL
jgi:hypothetical protein